MIQMDRQYDFDYVIRLEKAENTGKSADTLVGPTGITYELSSSDVDEITEMFLGPEMDTDYWTFELAAVYHFGSYVCEWPDNLSSWTEEVEDNLDGTYTYSLCVESYVDENVNEVDIFLENPELWLNPDDAVSPLALQPEEKDVENHERWLLTEGADHLFENGHGE
jgi:hypothetical protein